MLDVPSGWRITGIRITDSQGMDRTAEPAGAIVLESNAIALIEMENN